MSNKTTAFSVINYKGGTGKTCTLVNMAHAIANRGHKVLIIDTDPQGSISYHLGVKPDKTLFDIITNRATPKECVINARPNLDLIASNEYLFPAENFMHNQPNRETILRDTLTPLFDEYRYVFLDCAPSMNLMNQNAMLCAPDLLVPVSMEYMTLLGVKQLMNNVKLLNRTFESSVQVSKIIPTFYNKHINKTKHVHESLERVFSEYISSSIRVNVTISEAAGQGKTIFEFAPTSMAADDFNKLTEEVLKYER